MIGTRAHGRSRVYRYYTCFTRIRYDTSRCAASRVDADAIEEAVTAALASFYRHRHDLIADAIAQAQARHTASADCKRAELAAAGRELARTSAATDRYLAAFEKAPLTQKTSPPGSPISKPGRRNCTHATTNSPRRSPRRRPRSQQPRSCTSPSTSTTSSAPAPRTSARR